MTFNGATNICGNGIYAMAQSSYVFTLSIIHFNQADKTAFIVERTIGAYIAAITRHVLTFCFSVSSQYPSLDLVFTKILNTFIQMGHADIHSLLRFFPLKNNSVALIVFECASFVSNPEKSCQLGYVMARQDQNGTANIRHYSSTRSKCVTSSIVAAELFAAIPALD